MNPLDLIPTSYRTVVMTLFCILLALAAGAFAWQIQSWRYDQQLEHQVRPWPGQPSANEQTKHLALEQRLTASDETHYSELTNVQKSQ